MDCPPQLLCRRLMLWCCLCPLLLTGCHGLIAPGTLASRTGDEIVAAGRFVHTGTPVVLWLDPEGYDAYRVERRFVSYAESSWETSKVASKSLVTPNRYGLRRSVLTEPELDQVRERGWDLPLLQAKVDQFVLHFDASGTSRRCFKVLQDERGLSVHFLLDLDGTIFQTLDLKERAWHATTSNGRSVGIEIANIGAYSPGEQDPFSEWYQEDPAGRIRVIVPPRFGPTGIRTPGFVARPARPQPVTGFVQGRELRQYDLTPEQYQALIRLTATLCRVFPGITCDYPRDASGRLLDRKLVDEELGRYQGLLGHYHIQTDKVDPGPAFQWDLVVDGARKLMKTARPAGEERGATRLLELRR